MQFAAAEPFLNRPRLRFRRHRPQGIDPKFSDSLSRNGVGEVWNSGSLGWPITGKMKLGGLVPMCQIVSADSGRITRYAEKGFYGHAAAGARKDKMLIWESSIAIGAIE
jgi:hypothetical protein